MKVNCPHADCGHEWDFEPTRAMPEARLCPFCQRSITAQGVRSVKSNTKQSAKNNRGIQQANAITFRRRFENKT